MGSEMAVESRGPLNGALGLKFSKEKGDWQVDSMKSTRNNSNPLWTGGQVLHSGAAPAGSRSLSSSHGFPPPSALCCGGQSLTLIRGGGQGSKQ